MAKHNANVDIKGDLRVRGRVERHLRVHEEVEASAFYIRGVGELLPTVSTTITLKDGVHSFTDDTVSFNNSQFYLTKDSLGNPEVNAIFPEASSGVTFKDGVHSFTDDTLSFGYPTFYLTKDSQGNPTVNLGDLGVTFGNVRRVEVNHGSLSGLTVATLSNLPADVSRISIKLQIISTNSASQTILIQIGDSGGLENSSYSSISSVGTASDGFIVSVQNAASSCNAIFELVRVSASGTGWFFSGMTNLDGGTLITTTGLKFLGTRLDRIALTTSAGTATFDGGAFGITYDRQLPEV